ncbi:hypothetical protein FB451DRAFT_1375265 [Mycena latifolia]|nr:hypothetical protein FB451DRAFT_1375265 [Mycena latifolia]
MKVLVAPSGSGNSSILGCFKHLNLSPNLYPNLCLNLTPTRPSWGTCVKHLGLFPSSHSLNLDLRTRRGSCADRYGFFEGGGGSSTHLGFALFLRAFRAHFAAAGTETGTDSGFALRGHHRVVRPSAERPTITESKRSWGTELGLYALDGCLSSLGNREKSLTSGTPGTTGGCLRQGRGTGGIADTQTLGAYATQRGCRQPEAELPQSLGANGRRVFLFLGREWQFAKGTRDSQEDYLKMEGYLIRMKGTAVRFAALREWQNGDDGCMIRMTGMAGGKDMVRNEGVCISRSSFTGVQGTLRMLALPAVEQSPRTGSRRNDATSVQRCLQMGFQEITIPRDAGKLVPLSVQG